MRDDVTWIDGLPYLVRMPNGGRLKGDPSEWDSIIDAIGEDDSLFHWKGVFSWCQEIRTFADTLKKAVVRGGDSARCWFKHPVILEDKGVGFRPVLVPLSKDTLEPDDSAWSSLHDGERIQIGTLYLDDIPQQNPQDPVLDGDIPEYLSGSAIKLGDSDNDTNKQLHFIKAGNILIADRNILTNMTWDTLYAQGFCQSMLEIQLLDEIYRRRNYERSDF